MLHYKHLKRHHLTLCFVLGIVKELWLPLWHEYLWVVLEEGHDQRPFLTPAIKVSGKGKKLDKLQEILE